MLTVGVAAAWPTARTLGPALPGFRYDWLLLAAGFAAGQLLTRRFEFAGESQVLALSEVPLVAGLVFVGRQELLVAAVIGTAAGVALRRQAAVRSAFNVAIRTAETMVAAVCFWSLRSSHATFFPWRGLVAAAVAVCAANLVSAVGVQAVIALSTGRRPRSAWRPLLTFVPALTTFNVAVGWIAVVLLSFQWPAAVAFLGMVVVLVYGARAHLDLRDRHRDLEQMWKVSAKLSALHDADQVVKDLLVKARELACSRVSAFTLGGADGVTYTLGANGTDDCTVAPGGHPLLAVTAATGDATILATGRRDSPAVRAALAAAGLHDAVAATFSAGGRATGILVVGDRLGQQLSFKKADVTVIEGLANHTAMALRSSQLLDQLREEAAAKEFQALHDALTGLANRTLFNDRVEAALAARGGEASVVAVMVMDLDRFKEVNDTLGHHIGDVMLQQIASQLAEVVAGRGLVARLGGDEFAFMCVAATRAELAGVAGEVLHAAQATVLVEGLRLEVRASLGVAMAPDHGVDRSTLLRRADIAMYHAKANGSGVEVYEHVHDPHTTRRLVLASELRLALETSALELHYQPKAEIASGRVSGVEALLRWTHPVYGKVPPDEFIPLAEQSGLIRPLTLWALETSVAQLAVWRREGLALSLAVNLSARSVFDAELAEDLAGLLAVTGVPAGALTLEITESSLFGERPAGHSVLDHLARIGVRLSIDDFGTGYSSLSRLARLPVQEVKIDKSFVTTMLANPGHDAIVRSTIDLARNLGLDAVAEGVEDQATWRRLGQLGCRTAQGYYLSPPLRAGELPAWLWKHQRTRITDIRSLQSVGARRRH